MGLEINTFNFEDKQLEILTINGEYWFRENVAGILEYEDKKQVLQNLDPKYKKTLKKLISSTNSLNYHEGKAIFLNKEGLYQLINTSNKPKVNEFKQWIETKVFPQLNIENKVAI